jgi:hypothetical protein
MSSTTVILGTHAGMQVASVPTRGQRLLDMLNDGGSEFLQITDLGAPITGSSSIRAPLSGAVLRKSQLLLAILSEQYEAPERRRFASIPKKVYTAVLTVGAFEICGQLHLKGPNDVVTALARELGSFFPITNATIQNAGLLTSPCQSQGVIINAAFVSLFHIGAVAKTSAPITKKNALALGLQHQPDTLSTNELSVPTLAQ